MSVPTKPVRQHSIEDLQRRKQNEWPVVEDTSWKQIKLIERAKQEWEVTVDLMPQLVCVLDRYMCVLRANRTIEQWELGEVVRVKGKEVHALLHVDCTNPRCYLTTFLNRATEQLTEGQSVQEEVEDPILNRYLQLQIKPISPLTNINGEDRASFAVLMINDITEQKRVETALHQQTLELQARNEELDAFAHTVAHNLKGLLLPIISYAELSIVLYDSAPAETIKKDLAAIARSGQTMNRIIDELLLLAGVRKMEIEPEPLDMGDVVANVQQRLSYIIEQKHVEFVIPDTWPTALGYAPWIEEVWANYISNGIKYGGTPPRLELGATVSDSANNLVHFWIRDNGSGLMPDEQAQLFTPFTQLSQVRVDGHGLGLSIVQRIVEKLGGQVGVESEGGVGKGSTFIFSLPLA